MLSLDPKYRRYPNYQDVEGLMKSAGYWPKNTAELKRALAREQAQTGALAAAEEWERATGWTPFLIDEDTAPTVRNFDWDGSPVVQFDGGALGVVSVSMNGQIINPAYYRLLPRNALSNRQPYQALTWSKRFMELWGSRAKNAWTPFEISVLAPWGFCTICPADAWQQMLQAAGLVTLTQIENFQSIASLSQGGFSKSYDVVGILTQKDTADRWRREFPAAIKRYERLIF